MAFTVGSIAANDGAGATIPGGLLSADIAGGGAGPTFMYHSLVDGVAGSNKLQITASNALKVDGSAVTQPVSLASVPSHAVTNAGTFAVQNTAALPAGTNNIGDVDVLTVPADPFGANADASSATGSISAKLRFIASTGIPITGTVTVGSHAVTNAGTFVTQENGALLTAAQLIDDTIVAQGTALGTTKNSLIGGSVTTAAPTYTTGQISPLSLDTTGALRVTGGGGGTQYVEDAAAASDPTGNMLLAVRRDTLSASEVSADGDNIAIKATSKGKLWTASELRLGDTVADTGTGAAGSSTLRVVIANDSQLASVADNADAVAASASLLNNPVVSKLMGWNGTTYDRLQVDGNKYLKTVFDSIFTDDAAFTPGTSKVNVAGFQADESSTDSVDEGDAGSARMTLDRKQIVTNQPHTKGGLSAFCSIDLDETEEDVKTSPGQVYGFHAANQTTAPLYLRFYNDTAANVVVGTTATFLGPFEIPANASDHTVEIANFGGLGVEFSVAISAAVTTGRAANNAGAPATDACIVNVLYK